VGGLRLVQGPVGRLSFFRFLSALDYGLFAVDERELVRI
jgi:hypothetical protein